MKNIHRINDINFETKLTKLVFIKYKWYQMRKQINKMH